MRIGFGRQTASGAHGSTAMPVVCPEKIPLFASKSESLSARAMVSVSLVSHQLRCPKVSKGERREAGIQWIQPPKAVSDRSFRQTTSGAHGSANHADCLPRGKPFGAPAGAGLLPAGSDAPAAARVMGLAALWENSASLRGPQAHTPALPPVGIDAPTPAREKGLQPYGALTLFFRWRKKSVQKKASGTATPGKRLLLPILTAGLAMSRAMELANLPIRAERARARLFPPTKWAGLFPSAAYRRPAPAQLAGDILNPCRVGCFGVACVFLQGKRPAGNQIHAGLVCEP